MDNALFWLIITVGIVGAVLTLIKNKPRKGLSWAIFCLFLIGIALTIWKRCIEEREKGIAKQHIDLLENNVATQKHEFAEAIRKVKKEELAELHKQANTLTDTQVSQMIKTHWAFD